MCACIDCLSIQDYQSDCNRYKTIILKGRQDTRDAFSRGTRAWSIANYAVSRYKLEIQHHPRARDAVKFVQCKSIDSDDPNLIDLININCAYGQCSDCPTYKLPFTVAKLGSSDRKISFHTHETIPSCSKHLSLPLDSKFCQICSGRREGDTKGKFPKKL